MSPMANGSNLMLWIVDLVFLLMFGGCSMYSDIVWCADHEKKRIMNTQAIASLNLVLAIMGLLMVIFMLSTLYPYFNFSFLIAVVVVSNIKVTPFLQYNMENKTDDNGVRTSMNM